MSTSFDDARSVLEEYRATPAASTRRRVRLAIRMMDISDEYQNRLLFGAHNLLTTMLTDPTLGTEWTRKHGFWIEMWNLRDELVDAINALGLDRTQLAIAMATTIFDAEVIQTNERTVDAST